MTNTSPQLESPVAPSPSNGVRLTPREWLGVGAVVLAICWLVPWTWNRVEPIGSDPDQRVPFALSGDGWYFAQQIDRALADGVADDQVFVLGDSVVWGAYATRDDTLTHHLGDTDGRRFVNLGFNGGHPAALAGMLRHHGAALGDRAVLLHCNLLWLGSTRHDLSDAVESSFNHPELIEQFDPAITVYRADASTRLARAVAQGSTFLTWARHLQAAWFDGRDLATWTIRHPYLLALPSSPTDDHAPAETPGPWTERGIRPLDYPWVELEDSVQWRSFRDAVELLRSRGNRVTVLVGPFNEHALTPTSRDRYREIRDAVVNWCSAVGVDVLVPPTLPSELFADASHPLGAGYRFLAERLVVPR